MYESAADIKSRIDNYFALCEQSEKPPCISGLANALRMSRERLLAYGEGEPFCKIICHARSRVFQALEEKVIEKGSTGALFLLKNYGYSEKGCDTQKGEGALVVHFDIPRAEALDSADIKACEDLEA